ncbi:IS110 family transposase [Brasilonema sp. UFV-L1]|uniref:IS110 family transposase n=1 Tax=Brasilonema sp. UFV-L1 TaxID=2234130 RepID=UPI00403F73FA
MNRKKRSPSSHDASLSTINHNAAGIDIGADRHWVSVPAGRDSECVRSFGCFTAELYAMADWLKHCGIETVAMESTGVYWIAVFQILESRGFEVKLVNAHYVKTVPGRKSDVLDCQSICVFNQRTKRNSTAVRNASKASAKVCKGLVAHRRRNPPVN